MYFWAGILRTDKLLGHSRPLWHKNMFKVTMENAVEELDKLKGQVAFVMNDWKNKDRV
jgi:hypothetical protein